MDARSEQTAELLNWPDPLLYRSYSRLLTVYQDIIYEQRSVNQQRISGLCLRAFSRLCVLVVQSLRPETVRGRTKKHQAITDALGHLRSAHGSRWLQSLSSILGMLLHLSPVNTRER